MEKLAKEELEAIIRQEMPTFRVVEQVTPETDSPLPSQMRSPGLEAIQRKLRLSVKSYRSPESVFVTDTDNEDIVQSVRVAPRRARTPQDEKTVLISAAKKTIIGQQG